MEAIKYEAEVIETTLNDNVDQAVDKLLKFTQEYTANNQLKKRALKLNWDLERIKNKDGSVDQTIYQSLQQETTEILNEVLERLDTNPSEVQKHIDERNTIKEKLLNEIIDEQVVFTGEQISYKYGVDGFELKPFDMKMQLGEITAIIGANSSGKSTLIKVVAGEHLVQSGNISYPLFDQKGKLDWGSIKEEIAYIPQRLNEWDGAIKDYLYFTAATKGLKGKENLDEVNYIVHRLGLGEFLEKNWNQLSGGIQMRFELARALVWKPKLIILDEPLANLDIKAQDIFLRDLYHLAHSYKNPISILITSQHLHEIESISDRTIFLQKGEVAFNDLTSNIGQNRKYNVFEMTVNGTINDVRLALLKHGVTDITANGNLCTIKTDRNIKSSDILEMLINYEKKIQISLFRDISTSTKIMFE